MKVFQRSFCLIGVLVFCLVCIGCNLDQILKGDPNSSGENANTDNKNDNGSDEDNESEDFPSYSITVYNLSSADAEVCITTDEGISKKYSVKANSNNTLTFKTESKYVDFSMTGLFYNEEYRCSVSTSAIKHTPEYSLIQLTNTTDYKLSNVKWGDTRAMKYKNVTFETYSGIVGKGDTVYFKVFKSDYDKYKQIFFKLNNDVWEKFMLKQVRVSGPGKLLKVNFAYYCF